MKSNLVTNANDLHLSEISQNSEFALFSIQRNYYNYFQQLRDKVVIINKNEPDSMILWRLQSTLD